MSFSSCFPTLIDSPDAAIQRMLTRAQQVQLSAEQPVFHRGAVCERYFLVSAGRIKVTLTAPNGREVVLYHVDPGQSCVLTTAGLLGRDSYPADGITETAVEALIVESQDFDQALDDSSEFRRFVFANMGQRLADVIGRMEQVNFSSVESRLIQSLLTRADKDNRIAATHQQIALEIGSAREVVSRHLKNLEAAGLVSLERGQVMLLDPAKLSSSIHSV